MTQRTVLVVLFDGVQSLDATGPMEVFAGASRAPGVSYDLRTASLDGGPVRTSSGLTLVPDSSLAEAPVPHTLLVPGGHGTRDSHPELTAWLRAHAGRAERLVSVCTGALLLAEAGLLDAIAARARLSPRHFARAFRAETGTTPGRYVDRVRLEHARRLLEDTSDSVEQVARASGYGTPEAMRRAFVKALATAPAEYRRRFRTPISTT
ncbi:GlxA family transcriptional regulator [Streptomyces cyaneofuscatus]|uniref:GlxA family transcriptional regulator n=1 Tax=Streptomyces cyaneofuscatus TaxID=66883 RepID=UPI003F4C0E3A